jgi:hypothetical protein
MPDLLFNVEHDREYTIEERDAIFKPYDSAWHDWGDWLLVMLGREDLLQSACAAYQIGRFYLRRSYAEDEYLWELHGELTPIDSNIFVGMPPFREMVTIIQQQELQRPGMAGGFWQTTSGLFAEVGLDAREWLLETLAKSPTSETFLPLFPCNLAFHAHEVFSRDAIAIRRLIAMGRSDIAIMTVTDEDEKIEELAEILMDLGQSDDDETVRLAAWHLAYYYHILHPKGATLGFVELVDRAPEVDIFLLFGESENHTAPYAVVIYSKAKDQMMPFELAQDWAEQLAPESGFVEYHTNPPPGKRYADNYDNVDCVIIGYRSSQPWNPKDFI